MARWPSAQCDSDRQHRLLTAASARETDNDQDDEQNDVDGQTDRQTHIQEQIAPCMHCTHAESLCVCAVMAATK